MRDASGGPTVRVEAPGPVRGLVLVEGDRGLAARLAGPRLLRWSCPEGRLLGDVTYQGPPPTAGAVSPKGDRLAVATAEGAVRVLDSATLAVVAEMRPAPSARGGLSFSGDGTLLAGEGRGRRLELVVWNVSTGAPVASYADPAVEAAGIGFHPSGRMAALALLTGEVLLLDLGPGGAARTLSGPLMTSEALAFSPDGSVLLAASFDGVLHGWDTRAWHLRRLPGLPAANALAVSPDGTRAAIGRSSYNPPDAPAEVRVVELGTGRVVASRRLGIAQRIAVGVTGAGRARAAVARDNAIELWEIG